MERLLILPWFPILLGVGVGARLLGPARGLFLGILCACFWVAFVQASTGMALWSQPWSVTAVIAGAVAIAAMGAWSGRSPSDLQGPTSTGGHSLTAQSPSLNLSPAQALGQVAEELDRFDDWLSAHRDDANPWSAFDEFIRSTLYRCVGAKHVSVFALSHEGDRLIPLGASGALAEMSDQSARSGIVGHVLTTGRRFWVDDPQHGELVDRLAEQSSDVIAWCFSVSWGTRRLGIVTVGSLDAAPDRSRPWLVTLEKLVGQFWLTLRGSIESRSASQHDPVSGLAIRPAFLRSAQHALAESFKQGEPVAVAVFAIEGMRAMHDVGRWDLADELVQELSEMLLRKVRAEDCIGRFDGSRFILLLRRVDSALASLIVSQLMSRGTALCGDQERWGTRVVFRGGVSGSGTDQPDLDTLIRRALIQCQAARDSDLAMTNDIGTVEQPEAATP